MPDRGPVATAPLDWALSRIGDRWTLLVVEALMDRPRRFNELLERVRPIAPNILTRRLRDLEHDGLAVAVQYSQRPPRASYELTRAGLELAGALQLIASWGAQHGGLGPGELHSACGTPVETRRWCPTCDRSVGRSDDEHQWV